MSKGSVSKKKNLTPEKVIRRKKKEEEEEEEEECPIKGRCSNDLQLLPKLRVGGA
jgi:hypothetical protein